jgi:hypothetical protein
MSKEPLLTYRAELRAVTATELDVANAALAPGERPFVAFEADHRLQSTRGLDDTPLEVVLRWLDHPDERVVARAIRGGALNYWRRPKDEQDALGDARTALKARLLDEAEAEGMAWTPLLASLATSGGWNKAHVGPKTPAGQKNRLVPWVKAQTEGKPLLALLEAFPGDYNFPTLVAKHATALDGAVVARLILHHYHPRVRRELLKNAALTPDVVRYVLAEGVGEYTAGPRQTSDQFIAFVREVAPEGHRFTSQECARLEAYALSGGSSSGCWQAAHLLLAQPDVSRERIERLWHAVRTAANRRSSHHLDPFLVHPDTPIELLRTVTGEARARGKLAGNPTALSDPEIRAALREHCRGKGVLGALVRSAEPEEVNELFDLLVKRNPEGAAELVGKGELPDDLTVRKERLVRMLESNRHHVREAAIRLLSHMDRPAGEDARDRKPREPGRAV